MSRLQVILTGVLVWLTGCTSTSAISVRGHLDVQVLGFSGCPNTPEMLSRVKHAAITAGFDEQIVYIDLAALPEGVGEAWPTRPAEDVAVLIDDTWVDQAAAEAARLRGELARAGLNASLLDPPGWRA